MASLPDNLRHIALTAVYPNTFDRIGSLKHLESLEICGISEYPQESNFRLAQLPRKLKVQKLSDT